MTVNQPHRINDDIETRIEAIDDAALREFVGEVVAYERRNLPLSQPQYTDEYRSFAAAHLEESPADTDQASTDE